MGPTAQGKIAAICMSESKHVEKQEVAGARVKKDFGLEGDAHAGPGHRQVSIIDAGQVRLAAEKYGEIKSGAFGENFVVVGIDLQKVGMGSKIRLGDGVLVEVTQIGKVCHDRCAIYEKVGECPMSSEGVFGRVLEGGDVKKGDAAVVEKLVGRGAPQCAVVVVSDRCHRGETKDTAGELLCGILDESGFHAFEKVIVPDEKAKIAEALKFLCDERGADIVFTAGGTGMALRDVTPEATAEVIERDVPGISEALRMLTMAKAPRSILSRGVSGIRGRTLVINFPGSEKAVAESALGQVDVASFAQADRHLGM
ncbi:MAG: molybdenum cofactor synthesis domain-containing protein, partial [Pseudomonadota bacterium]